MKDFAFWIKKLFGNTNPLCTYINEIEQRNLIAGRILLRPSLWISMTIPIFIAFVLNIGLIFNFSNHWPCIFGVFADYLSQQVSDKYTVGLLIGQVTVLIVFFTFIQFSYSNKSLSPNIIRKYIIKSDRTLWFLGLQLSILAILGAFSIIYPTNIYMINAVLSVSGIIVSAILSLKYFFWLSEHISPDGLFDLLKEMVDFKEVAKLEEKLSKNAVQLKKEMDELENAKGKISFDYSDTVKRLIVKNSNPDEIIIKKLGKVNNINISKLNELLTGNWDKIETILFSFNIGDDILIIGDYVFYKIGFRKETDSKQIKELKQYIKSKNDEFQNIVTINEKYYADKNNNSILEDIASCLFFAIDNASQEEVDKFANKLIYFFDEISSKYKINKRDVKIKLNVRMFREFITKLNGKLENREVNNQDFNTILEIVDGFIIIAIKICNYDLFKTILKLSGKIFDKTIEKFTRFDHYVLRSVQYTNIVTLIKLVYNTKNPDKEIFKENKVDFYIPFIKDSVKQAVYMYYQIILNSSKFEKDKAKSYLLANGGFLCDFLAPLRDIHFENKLKLYNNEIGVEDSKEIIAVLKNSIIYFEWLLYKYVRETKLPDEVFKSVVTYLVGKGNIGVFNFPGKNGIEDYIFFADNPFVDIYGAEQPIDDEYQNFLITYSLYKHVQEHKEEDQFLPSELIKSDTDEINKEKIKQIILAIANYDGSFLSRLLEIDKTKIEKLKEEYRVYLNNLLGNVKLRLDQEE
jgi:hypothetical protein